jgi:hypothetical protein
MTSWWYSTACYPLMLAHIYDCSWTDCFIGYLGKKETVGCCSVGHWGVRLAIYSGVVTRLPRFEKQCVWTFGPGRCSESLRAGRFGNRISVRAIFSAPVQSSPRTHLTSYKMGNGSVPLVKRSELGVNHLAPRLNKEQKYTSSGPSWPVVGELSLFMDLNLLLRSSVFPENLCSFLILQASVQIVCLALNHRRAGKLNIPTIYSPVRYKIFNSKTFGLINWNKVQE